MSTSTTPCQATACPNGHPASKLECPTCNKLGIRGSYFCGQACFKADWKTHKIIHDLAKGQLTGTNADGSVNPWPTFDYKGPVRPRYPLSPLREVPAHIPRPDYVDDPDGNSLGEMREFGKSPRILTPAEQEKMRVVCRLGREVLDAVAAEIRPGVTTDYLDEVTHRECVKRDAYPSPLGYHKFPKSVCTSVNEVICHGIPDQTVLVEGDIINLDVSVYYDGFHSDLNETYPVGAVAEPSARLMKASRDSLYAAIALCKPGALFRDLGKTIEPLARAAGCATVRQYVGHGINTLFHCEPNYVPHYAKNRAVGTMKPGMCFTIEPMLNLGTHPDVHHWPDDWTATTIDGQRSAQFEETLLITETGVEILTQGKPREDLA